MPAAEPGDAGPAPIDAFLADLARWTADTRGEEAAASRVRERWLRQQAVEDARFTGVLVDLAEQHARVALHTAVGRSVHGRMAAVGRDFCVVVHDDGTATFVALAAVGAVRPEPGQRSVDADSERAAPLAAGLAGVLAHLAPDRPRVRVVVEGGEGPLTGELRTVGADVATLRLDGRPPATVYVRLPGVREVTLLG